MRAAAHQSESCIRIRQRPTLQNSRSVRINDGTPNGSWIRRRALPRWVLCLFPDPRNYPESIQRGRRRKNQIMKNQNTKSMTTHVKRKLVLATCLILAALGPPAAELSRGASLNGSPPVPANQTFTISGICAFDVQVTVNGNQILM